MGGSASYRLAKKIRFAEQNGAPQSEIDDLRKQHEAALTAEREKRAMKRLEAIEMSSNAVNASIRNGMSKKVIPEDFHWNRSYEGTSGREYGTANTSDALAEIQGKNGEPKQNSLSEYLDENGNLSPERAALHKQIIDNLLAEARPVEEGVTPVMVMYGGGPASGKTTVIKALHTLPDGSVTIDPDEIKKYLPGYLEMSKKDKDAAAFYHEESSMVAKQFAEVLFNERYNAIYDGTGDGSVNSVMKKINAARKQGYKIDAAYVTIDTDEALRRNQQRFDKEQAKGGNPRLPPAEMVRETHKKVTQILTQLSGEFDTVTLYDNNGEEGSARPIATGTRGGRLTPLKGEEAAFEAFLKKADE